MPRPSILVKVFAAAMVTGAALAAVNACSAPDSVTPMCTFNVGGNGVIPENNGCEQFAPCFKDGIMDPTAAKCCVDDTSDASPQPPLTGTALTACLYLYGVGLPPASTSSSTSSSSGGAGGSAADAGDGG